MIYIQILVYQIHSLFVAEVNSTMTFVGSANAATDHGVLCTAKRHAFIPISCVSKEYAQIVWDIVLCRCSVRQFPEDIRALYQCDSDFYGRTVRYVNDVLAPHYLFTRMVKNAMKRLLKMNCFIIL